MHVFVWGSGGAGQLGLGNRDDFAVPQELHCAIHEILPETLTTGGCHSAALTGDGRLYVWGDNEKAQLGCSDESSVVEPTRQPLESMDSKSAVIRAVACGWSHTVALVEDSPHQRLWSWGAHQHHQLGRTVSTEEPCEAPGVISLPTLVKGCVVRSISCGWKHSLLALDDGSVFSWGSGRHGELGLGPTQLSATAPTRITALNEQVISKVSCGWQHSVFHSAETSAVYTCGNNRHGQLGTTRAAEVARFLPAPVVMVSNDSTAPLLAKQVAVGWHFVVCLSTDGALYSWGKGAHGQLGLGSLENCDVPTSIDVLFRVEAVACGSEHSMVVGDDGDVYTCGWGEHGNLGHGDTENKSVLSKVQYFNQHNLKVVAATAGGAVSVALAVARPAS